VFGEWKSCKVIVVIVVISSWRWLILCRVENHDTCVCVWVLSSLKIKKIWNLVWACCELRPPSMQRYPHPASERTHRPSDFTHLSLHTNHSKCLMPVLNNSSGFPLWYHWTPTHRSPSSAVSVGRRLVTASDSKIYISVGQYSVSTTRCGTGVGLSPRILLAVLDG
jgi:hypothetical protein